MIEQGTQPFASAQEALWLLRGMQLIRTFEENVRKLYAAGAIPGLVHLCAGQEAVAVGVCSLLNADDMIASNHRGHGHCLAKGADVGRTMAEIMGRSTGYSLGRGGSLHIFDAANGNLGTTGIVGGGIPLAAGAALSAPSPADAKGLMAAAIRDDGPVVFVEDRMLYNQRGAVPEGDHLVPLGRGDVKRQGRDVTIIAVSRMVQVALAAADLLAKDGIAAEVVDPRSLVPLDVETLVGSVKKTSRALVVDGGYRQYGVTGEIASTVAELAFDWLDAPVLRLGGANVPIPFSKTLEPLVLPDAERLKREAAALVRGQR